MKPDVLDWDEVEPAAKLAFSIWTSGTELQWARKAWGILVKRGLANYSNSVERCLCALRFIAMCDVYLDFIAIAFEEDHGSDYTDWAGELECSPIALGVLLNRFGMDSDDDIDDMESIVRDLSRWVGKETIQALVEGFGGTSGFFQATWLSAFDKEKAKEEAEFALNELSGEKEHAFSWVQQGCDPYRVA